MLTKGILKSNNVTVASLIDFFDNIGMPISKPTIHKKLDGLSDWTSKEADALRQVQLWREDKPPRIPYHIKQELFKPDGRTNQFGKIKNPVG